jgi:zinc transport system substrate-binding protein
VTRMHAMATRRAQSRPRAVWILMSTALALGLPGTLAGCSGKAGGPDAGSLVVAVSIPPQAWFAERIGGRQVSVQVVLKPGDSPATYDPTPRELARLADARIYFAVGVPMETRLLPELRRDFPDLQIVDTTAGIAELAFSATTHEPAAGGDLKAAQGSGELDPHIWLSPRLAKILARNMANALIALDPARTDSYQAGLAGVEQELDRLDAELKSLLAPLAGRELLVYHPAFGYLAAEYGLVQVAIESGGQQPSPRQLADLLKQARTRHPGAIFVQPQFSATTAHTLARELGVPVVELDPLARNYPDNLQRMAVTIRNNLLGG